jgi:hypothetical protein
MISASSAIKAQPALIEVRDGEESQAGLTPLFARQTALGSGTNRQGWASAKGAAAVLGQITASSPAGSPTRPTHMTSNGVMSATPDLNWPPDQSVVSAISN